VGDGHAKCQFAVMQGGAVAGHSVSAATDQAYLLQVLTTMLYTHTPHPKPS
jgi:hypothetical protein